MKFSSIIISVLVVILVSTTFLNFYSNLADKYPVTMDARTEAVMGNYSAGLSTLEEDVAELNRTVFNVQNKGFTDLLGGFLSGGYDALKIAGKSLTTLDTMIETTTSAIGLPSYWYSIARLVVLILAIFIVISVLVGTKV